MTKPSTKPNPSKQAPPESYEAASRELSDLVQRMQSGQMPLDDLLVNYERGAYLLGFCREKLQALEQQISVLDHGQLKPWADKA